MSFNLSTHLADIKRQEKDGAYSLADYSEYIKLMVEIFAKQKEQKKHNAQYISQHFPNMRHDFAQGVYQVVGFKFQELTEEILMKAKTQRKRKEEKCKLKFSKRPQKTISLDFLQEATSKKLREINTSQKAEKSSLQDFDLLLALSTDSGEKKVCWEKAGEMLSKMNQGELKTEEIERVPTLTPS